jgi:hypothetical protein
LNFVCHCSICRLAKTEPAAVGLAASGFQAHQIQWQGWENVVEKTPQGSKNARFYCKSCGDYMAEDATGPLGLWALPHAAATRTTVISDEYLPNHHIFYDSRDRDVDPSDSLPKWANLPQGPLSKADSGVAERSRHPSVGSAHAPQMGRHAPTGRYSKDVLPLSPTRPPYPTQYVFTEADPIPNHTTRVQPEKIAERVARKYDPSPNAFVAPLNRERDVVIIGGGHNGLVTAAYLASSSADTWLVAQLSRRKLSRDSSSLAPATWRDSCANV